MTVVPILLSLLGTFVLAAVLTPLVRLAAHRLGCLARPKSDRWHREPVAMLGGYAIAGGFAVGVAVFADARPLIPVLAGSALMFTLGALDDGFHFRATTKLVAQTAIAAVMVFLSPQVVVTGMPVIDLMLVVTWIVGITNAFNLLDNIDGLSAGIAALAALFYLGALAPAGVTPLAIAMAVFAGAALGFLVYNFRPASIFMGDSGSLFLGSFLGGAALLAAPQLKAGIAPVAAIPLLILLIPIFDTVFVTITRRMAGRSPMVGGRDHLSHRLVAIGIDERTAVLSLYGLAALGGGIALSLQYTDFGYAAIPIALYLILLASIGLVLGHVESHGEPEAAPRSPLVSDVAYHNRLYEVLLDAAFVALAYYAAFRLRFPGPEFQQFLTYFAASFPLVLASQLTALAMAGKYRQVWRTFGATEVLLIVRGLVMGVGGSVLLMLYLYRFQGFSRLVFAIDGVILAALLIGSRLAITSIDEYLRKQRSRGRPALIYGAGRGGVLLARELLENRALDLRPVGFVDDDPEKRRIRVEGLPVLGTFADLAALIERHEVAEVLISTRAIDRHQLADIAATCRERGVAVRSMRFSLEEIGPVPHIRHVQSR